MDDSFKVRVDKVFGSLEASSSSFKSYPSSSIFSSSNNTNTNLPSLWSLTDDEIERREWNRDKACPDDDEQGPVVVSLPHTKSKVDSLLAKHQMQPSTSSLKDLQDEIQELLNESDDECSEDEEIASSSIRQLEKPDDHNDDEWDVRTSVGLDSTLDFEDEEDADDQVAIGEEAVDLYQKDITDYEADMDSSHELPKTFRDVKKDPRANHVAAQRRIKEDSKAAAAAALKEKLGDANDLKSILINRDNQLVMKSEKRVMFEPGCKEDSGQDSEQEIIAMEECTASDIASFHSQGVPSVPDYVRNPSKYTHYTFDSSTDVSEETNKKAYMDFLNLLKGPQAAETQDGEDRYLLNSVTFTPKKKPVDSLMKNEIYSKKDEGDGNKENMYVPLGIAAEDAQDFEMCAMEEDEPEIAVDKSANLPKPGRRYRTKAGNNLDETVT